MDLRQAGTSRIRALSIILVPLALSGLISTYLILSTTSSQLRHQSAGFGQAICDHLAISVTDHLVNDDRLGLNVLLSELLNRHHFDSASVYDTSNALLAQTGQAKPDSKVYMQQVTFQDAITGYVKIGINENVIQSQLNNILLLSISLHGLLALFLVITTWIYGDMIYLWIMQRSDQKPAVPDTDTDEAAPKPLDPAATILVFKVRPLRLLAGYRDEITRALALYSGELDKAGGDDLVVCFDKTDQLFQAICSGLLVLEIFKQIDSPIVLKAGMHQALDGRLIADIEKAKKHASYLASMADNRLLASRRVQEAVSGSEQYVLQPFHSSMSPDGEVFCIDGVINQDLIEGQAKFMLSQA